MIVITIEHDVLGKVIKNARTEKCMSQEQLAEIINCSPRHIMSIENEHSKPSFWRLYNIIRLLNISADSIFYPERRNTEPQKEELINLIKQCDDYTIKIITAAVKAAIDAKP